MVTGYNKVAVVAKLGGRSTVVVAIKNCGCSLRVRIFANFPQLI